MKNKNISFSFSSDHFNRSESKDFYINPNCYGDDLAAFLLKSLKKQSIKVEEDGPDQEDFGWYINFEFEGTAYSCVVLYQEDVDRWLCVLEYNAGLIGSLFGKRNKPIPSHVSEIFKRVITSHPSIFNNIEWSNLT